MKFSRIRRSNSGVQAKRLQSGDIVLSHGECLYRIRPSDYVAISYGASADGRHALLGALAADGQHRVPLATFDSAAAARNAHRAVGRAYAGFGGTWWKWPVGLAGLLVAFNVLLSFASPVAATGTMASMDVETPTQSAGGLFDPNEPTLEELAAGNYRPNLKVKVPEVTLPELTCATPSN